MAWTAPRTWVTGEILSSTNLNVHVRDNLLFLFAAALPAGTILDYGAAAAPTGYLICDGSAVSRTTFSALYAVIGITYGVGDGSSTFNLPDFRGRTAVGYAISGGHSDVANLGANEGVAVAFRRPKHQTTKNLTLPDHAHSIANALASGASQTGPNAANSASFVTATGGATSLPAISGSIGTNNGNDPVDTPAYLVVNKIVKT